MNKYSDARTPLKKGSEITLCFSDEQKYTYIIDENIGRGGFALIYSSHEKDSDASKYYALKEYFPNNGAVRDENEKIGYCSNDGQILPFSEADLNFMKEESENTKRAATLYDRRGELIHQNNSDVLCFEGPYLATNGNYYCLIDTVFGESLTSYIKSGFKKGICGKTPNRNFGSILKILTEITKQLSSLHGDKGMLHLDLSTDNIYLTKIHGGTEIYPHIIDFGSAFSPRKYNKNRFFTKNAFSSNEVVCACDFGGDKTYVNALCEASDTYSICSILFYSIMGYTIPCADGNEDKIKKSINEIYPKEVYSDFSEKLYCFFTKGLALNPKDRFVDVSMLLKALKQLQRAYEGKGIISKVSMDDVTSYMLLEKYPIYEPYVLNGGNDDLNVLCFGSGEFIEKLVLAMLSMGQMIGRKLCITIASKNALSLRDKYIKTIPEIIKYSNINSDSNVKNEYVSFDFIKCKNLLDEDEFKAVMAKSLKCRYVVISLGSNEQNFSIAHMYSKFLTQETACKEFCGLDSRRRVLYYIGDDVDEIGTDHSYYLQSTNQILYVPFSGDDFSSDIDRVSHIAFKFHHLYSKLNSKNKTWEDSLKEFSTETDGYSQKSSLATSLHAKYKLASVGVYFSEEHTACIGNSSSDISCHCKEHVIEKYYSLLEENKNNLVELEHRRWLMFMISCGYQAPTFEQMMEYSYEYVASGKFNKGFKRKDFPYLFHNTLLTCDNKGLKLGAFPKEKWDSFKSIEEIDKLDLDELDKMSLKVHFLSGEKIKSESYFENVSWIIKRISYLIPKGNVTKILENSVSIIKQSFLDAVKNPNMAENLFNSVLNAKKTFSESGVNASCWFEELENVLSLFKEYLSYLDYKRSDESNVRNLLWAYFAERDFEIIKIPSMCAETKVEDNVKLAMLLEAKTIRFFGKFSTACEFSKEEALLSSKIPNISIYKYKTISSSPDDIKDSLIDYVKSLRGNVIIDVTGCPIYENVVNSIADELNNQYSGERKVSVASFDFKDNKIINVNSFSIAPLYNK